MKRIAVAAEQDVVSNHFGLCENFLIFSTEDGKIRKIEKVANPGHLPCELPEFVSHVGADVVITGSMGKSAASQFALLHIPYVIGAKGEARAAVDAFIHGDLESKGELCDAWTCEFFDQR